LAAAGEAGVSEVHRLLKEGIDTTLALLGSTVGMSESPSLKMESEKGAYLGEIK
jgi:hypothetical protein